MPLVPPPTAVATATNAPEWSVGDLASALKRTLEDAFGHVRLRFESGTAGEIAVVPQADCRADPAACARLKTTDFATEFSLW